MTVTTLAALRTEATAAFNAAGLEDVARRVGYTLAAALGIDRALIAAGLSTPLPDDQVAKAREYINRTAAREPLERILGCREFYGITFGLNEATLSPRPDTETLVEAALALRPRRILDVGTGSGCVVISLLHNLPMARATATDISIKAIEQAQKNAVRLGMADRVTFVETNYIDGIKGPFDVIVTNPPYIPASVIPTLDVEVREHDPIAALDGGVDGLDAYRVLLQNAAPLLAEGGKLLVEIGAGQQEDVGAIAMQYGWQAGPIQADLAGIQRVLTFFR